MSRGRVAFIGNMTLLPDLMYEERKQLTKCYLSYHPDAKRWLPDAKDPPHLAMWARLDVEDIYYVGGFGDSHYIGFIPVDLYSETGFGWGLDLQ
ncbi:hypothetical protein M231_01225 [Tremella mesenterica]|uniref:CREG-like beta-barrel domain-containing protein n=2 Tax=Tremella mesenterica TaxID=5217 RepID=A0A4V1M4T8_TREME|nr:hypothetical protein M231_01225 [Tremella mesenterica]